MREREIRKRVETALEEFLSNESELLERNAGERAIAGILATYLATRFPDHDVDVEYDRHGLERKTLNLPPVCRGGGRKKVIPDIVVHRRGVDEGNLLAVEATRYAQAASLPGRCATRHARRSGSNGPSDYA
jgi:hypothetical protein